MGILIQSSRRVPGWAWVLVWFGLALQLSAQAPVARPLTASAESVKASYVLVFARSTKWPESNNSAPAAPFVIGLLQADALQAPLKQLLTGEQLHGRPVEIRRLGSAAEAKDCQLVYLGHQPPEALREACSALAGRPVLLLADHRDGLAAGSTLCLWQVAEKIRYDISIEAMERAGLEVSADVIELSLSKGKRKRGPR
jgi:hypothetical protein